MRYLLISVKGKTEVEGSRFAQDYPDMVARCSYWELLSLAERRAA